MNTGVEHPDIRYVVYLVHRDGTLTGAMPRMRHDPDCGHFDWDGGERLGTPVLANEEQMSTLKACTSCVQRRSDPAKANRAEKADGTIRQLCPTCYQTMPLTGTCDNCD